MQAVGECSVAVVEQYFGAVKIIAEEQIFVAGAVKIALYGVVTANLVVVIPFVSVDKMTFASALGAAAGVDGRFAGRAFGAFGGVGEDLNG